MALKGLKLLCDEASVGGAEQLTSLNSALSATNCTLKDVEEGSRPDVLVTSSVLSETYKVLRSIISLQKTEISELATSAARFCQLVLLALA